MKQVYLDNNATTQVHPDVLKEMIPFYKNEFGNPSSIYKLGRVARESVENSRMRVANILSADPSEIFFTSSGSESDNFAIKGIAFANAHKGKHIITTSIEHAAVLNTCKYLEKSEFFITYLPVNEKGLVDMQVLAKSIRNDTILISIMYANNEVGTIQPIKQIGELISNINLERKKENLNEIYFHTDAVQALGKLDMNVKDLNVDLLSISGHKINAPKGIGSIYIRKGTRIDPIIHGGHQEYEKRAGTENVAQIAGFGKACEIANREARLEFERLLDLKKKLYNGLTANIKDVYLNGDFENSLPNTLNVSFRYIEGESIIMNLDLLGVAVSSGSACTSGTTGPSHVLKSMNIEPLLCQSAVRFSLGKFNTEKDVDYVIKVLPKIVDKLRKLSPLYSEK